ncbi:MAG: septum formation initiator family protein [Bacilli bacterium]
MKKITKKAKHRLMILGTISVIAIGYFFMTFISYTFSFISLKKQEKSLKNELVFLQDSKADLKIEIQKLNDPAYVARYAKEKYLYSSNGEYVIKIDDKVKKDEVLSKKNNTVIYGIIGGSIVIAVIYIVKKKR